MTLHIGFSGTRRGMSDHQFRKLRDLLLEHTRGGCVVAHHGCCVGADAQFARTAGASDLVHVVGHPPRIARLLSDDALACCDEIMQPVDYHQRNAAIVAASQIMIAAPLENTPQPRGGTWATIRMSLKALRAGRLQALYVVGREGKLLEHKDWSVN